MEKDLNILIINGPNINMLGVREPEQYGSKSYKDVEMELHEYSFELGVNIEIFQSNCEGEIVDKIQYALGNFDGIVINAGAYTHTSVAIRDALLAVKFRRLKFTFQTYTGVKNFVMNQCLPISASGKYADLKLTATNLGLQGLVNFLTSAND